MMVEHLLRCGYYNTAVKLARQSGIEVGPRFRDRKRQGSLSVVLLCSRTFLDWTGSTLGWGGRKWQPAYLAILFHFFVLCGAPITFKQVVSHSFCAVCFPAYEACFEFGRNQCIYVLFLEWHTLFRAVNFTSWFSLLNWFILTFPAAQNDRLRILVQSGFIWRSPFRTDWMWNKGFFLSHVIVGFFFLKLNWRVVFFPMFCTNVISK